MKHQKKRFATSSSALLLSFNDGVGFKFICDIITTVAVPVVEQLFKEYNFNKTIDLPKKNTLSKIVLRLKVSLHTNVTSGS